MNIWRYTTLAIGIALLLIGGEYYKAPDWDVGISLIMAFFAFTTAPWATTVIVTRQWSKYPQALLLTWWGVDGCYWVYWSIMNPVALELMRDVNWPASLVLYLTCGLLWSETLIRPATQALTNATKALSEFRQGRRTSCAPDQPSRFAKSV